MEYRGFDATDNANYRSYYQSCLQMTADMTPFNLLSLRGEPAYVERAYGYGLCFHQGTLGEGKTVHFCPVGDWDTADWKGIFASEFPAGTYFWGIPELLMKKWRDLFGDRLEIEESRDDWDYIWYTKRMVELQGSKFKSMRGARNRFMKTYQCSEEPLTPEHFDEIRDFHRQQTELLLERTTAGDMVEFDDDTFETALDNWDAQYLYGTIFRVEGAVAGVLINEILDENMVVGLYQKQDRSYNGITEYIYVSDCQYLMDRGYVVINVMSDVGSEGLRVAKMHTNPLVLLKKYNITVK